MNKVYVLFRIETVKGHIKSGKAITAYSEYAPLDIIEDIRLDSRHEGVPRVMCSMDTLYGTMDKEGRFEVAKQHKLTAPKTYISYEISVENIDQTTP